MLILFAGAAFLICRAPYGYSFSDEPFSITLGQRLSYGDALIVNEWYIVQPIAPVLMLFYRLYHVFFSSNTGIILSFRYCYCILWFLTCLTVYLALSNKYDYAIWVFLFLILFAPFDIMSLSYKSFGVMCSLLLASVVFSRDRIGNGVLILSISLISCLFTLACPYFGFFYISVMCCGMIINFRGKQFWNNRSIIICLLITISLALIYLYVFILRKYSIQKMLDTLPYIFMDTYHIMPWKEKAAYMFSTLIQLASKCKLYTVILIITTVLAFFKRKIHRYRLPVFMLACFGYFLALLSYLAHGFYVTFNYEVIDIALLGMVAFLLLDNKPWNLFTTFSLISCVYIVVDCMMSSDCGLHEFGMNSLSAGASGIVFVVELCREFRNEACKLSEHRLIMILCSFVLLAQIGTQGLTRIGRQFWDSSPLKCSEIIEVGACKGMRTTETRKKEYSRNYDALRTLLNTARVASDDRFLALHADPVQYLDAELPFATFTVWTFFYDEFSLAEQLSKYYKNTPEMSPDVIFALQKDDLKYLNQHIIGIDMDDFVEYSFEDSSLFVRR